MNLRRIERMKEDIEQAQFVKEYFPTADIGSVLGRSVRRCVKFVGILLDQYIYLTRENIELRKKLEKTQRRSDRMERALNSMPVSWSDLGIDEIDEETGETLPEPDAWSEEQEEFFAFVEKMLDNTRD